MEPVPVLKIVHFLKLGTKLEPWSEPYGTQLKIVRMATKKLEVQFIM